MKFRVVSAFCLAVIIATGTRSVGASEIKDFDREIKCEVGEELELKDISKVLDEEDKDREKILESIDGKWFSLKEGDCFVMLKNGEIVHVVVGDIKVKDPDQGIEGGSDNNIPPEEVFESNISVLSNESEDQIKESSALEEGSEYDSSEMVITKDIVGVHIEEEVSLDEGKEEIVEPEPVIEEPKVLSEQDVKEKLLNSLRGNTTSELEEQSSDENPSTDIGSNESKKTEGEKTQEGSNLENTPEIKEGEDEDSEEARSKESSVDTEEVKEKKITKIDSTNVELKSRKEMKKKKVGVADSSSKIRESSHTGRVGTYFVLPVLEGSLVEYVSTNEDVARVSEDGVVLLVGEGKARIIVNTEDKVYACDVTAINADFDNSDLVLKWNEVYQFDLKETLPNSNITYSVVDGTDIASVSEDGVVNFTGSGTVIVRANVDGMAFNKRITCDSRRKALWDGMQPYIQQCLGTPYVFGGGSPGVGLDCSAYVSYVYSNVGLVSDWYTAQGLFDIFGLTSNPPQPGDLVYFQGTYDTPDYITHVGIYAGDGMMYHSGKPNQLQAIVGYYAEHLVGYGSID